MGIKTIVPQRFVIYGTQGKIRGVIENRILRKAICGAFTCCANRLRLP
jgi:hypothetical protein